MGAITNLCSRAVLIVNGQIIADNNASTIVGKYIGSLSCATDSSYMCQEKPNNRAWIDSASLKSANGKKTDTFLMTEFMIVECLLKIVEKSRFTLSVQIKEMNNSPVCHFPNGDSSYILPSLPGSHRIKVRIPSLNLYPGEYLLQLTLCEFAFGHFEEIHIVESISFHVEQDHSLCRRPLSRHAGLVFSYAEWSD